jgi:DNA-binding NarL/FixJ family response regulator
LEKTDAVSERAVLALAADLLFASRIREAGLAAGVHVDLVRTPADLLARVAERGGAGVIVDLDTRGLDVAGAITALVASGADVVAFAAHVRSDLIAAARAAGAQRVLARSGFVQALPELLRTLATPAPQ